MDSSSHRPAEPPLKPPPALPKGGDLIFRAIWGIFNALCIHGICTVEEDWMGGTWTLLKIHSDAPSLSLIGPSFLLVEQSAPPPSSQCIMCLVCHSLSTLHRSACKRSVPSFPGECKPHRQGPGLIHFSVPGKYQRLKSSWKEHSTIIMIPWLEHLLPVFRSTNGSPALRSKATLRV